MARPGDREPVALVTVEAYLKGTAALVSAVFAVAILATGWRRVPQRFLAAFLALISVNQAMDVLWSLHVSDTVLATRWFRLGTIAAALDPLVLYYFASIYPQRTRLNATWAVALVATPAAFFAFASLRMLPEFPASGDAVAYALQAGLTTYTMVVYLVILAVTLLGMARHHEEPAWRLLAPAMAVAAMPLVPRVVVHAQGALLADGVPAGWSDAWIWAATVSIGLALLAAVALALGRAATRAGAPARHVALALGFGVGVSLLLYLVAIWDTFMRFGFWERSVLLLDVARIGTSLRWLIFGGFVSVAIVRHQMFEMPLAARRRAARFLIGAAILVVAATAVTAWNALGGDLGLQPFEWALIAALLAASQGFRSVLDRVAWRVYGVPMPGDVLGRHEAYRLAAMQVVLAGRSPAQDDSLRRLREELGVDETSAATLERVAEASAGGPLQPGHVVQARYRIDELIARGGGGRVFSAHDLLLDRRVVVKEVPRDAGVDAALAEARVAGSIDAPGVVVVHDVIQRPDSSLLVSEHVAGGTLAERVDREGPLPATEGLALLLALLDGLQAVHARGIVHRDLKPSNILLTLDGRPKIADFGIARLRSGSTTMSRGAFSAAGTPAYMAPEQLRGEPATCATDVHAVGTIARRCIRAPLPPSVDAVISRALAADPDARYQDAASMRRALGAADTRASRPEHEQAAPDTDDITVG